LCEIDQPAVACKDTRASGFDKHGNPQFYGSDISRKCTPYYNYEVEYQCNNGQHWYDAGDRRTAVQRETPVYCNVREKRILSPGTWPRPEFDCKTNHGVSPSDRIGMKLSMNYDQCHGYFAHADWSFTWSSGGCYRIKENARTSSRGGSTTCIKTRSANPVIGSAEEKERKAEIANGNYVKTAINTDKCPEGSVVVDTEDRCRAAAKKFGMKFNDVGENRSWDTSPKGCIFDKSRGVFLNEEYTTNKHPTQARICEKGGRAPLSWWAAEEPDTDHECAENCRDWWRGDGRCDAGCNVASCNFDDGDCGAGCKYNCPGDENAVGQEKAVGGFHTDKYCEGHSNCREYAQGSCDDRNNRCHYGSWQGGAASTVAMHAAGTSKTPLAVTAFAAFGVVVTLYGAFKHFTKQ